MIMYSFIPCLLDETGHHFNYHDCVGKALKVLKVQHIKYIPKNVKLKELSEEWKKEIIGLGGKKSFINNLIKPLGNIIFLYKLFRGIKKNDTIFFIEYFTVVHLFTIFIACFFSRTKVNLWILYRTDLDQLICNGKFHYFLHVGLRKICRIPKIKIFTDSALLQEELDSFFKQKSYLLPIPHVFKKHKILNKINKNEILCWWPGGSIREEKGYKNIIKMVPFFSKNSRFKLVLADICANNFINKKNIIFIPSSLPQIQYQNWMSKVDLVILPYDKNLYTKRTSGIFVEAICAKKIPIVTNETWMSSELLKYDLKELIMDWESLECVIEKLEYIYMNRDIRNKIEHMSKQYFQFHSVESFSREIQKHL